MWFLLLSSLGLAGPTHVEASRLNLREAPSADAAVEGLLRIGTRVEVLEKRGKWVRISLVDRPAEHPVTGWVQRAFLSSRAPTLASVGRMAPSDARRERLAALSGAGDPSDERTHLAVCDGVRVEYLGFFDASRSFEDRAAWTPSAQELVDLSAHHWTAVDPSGASAVVEGSPFVRPFVTERWNENDPSPYAPGSCDGICDGASHVILGPCETVGQVFASRSARGVGPGPVDSTRSGFFLRGVDGESEDIAARGTWLEGVVKIVDAHEGWTSHESIWVMKSGSVAVSMQLTEAESGDESTPPPVIRTFLEIAGLGTVGLAELHGPTVRGWALARLDEASAQTWALYMEGWGC